MELKRVVVTGLGAITPIGNSVPEFWENLVNGVSGAGPITHFDASLFKTQFACEVKGFDATKYIDRKEARKMARFTLLALGAAANRCHLRRRYRWHPYIRRRGGQLCPDR